jgi:hypothetical protein
MLKMNKEIIQKLEFSLKGLSETYSFPLPLLDSFQIISNFFENSKNNKLCIVFPSKESSAQWLALPTVLNQIKNDFTEFKDGIFESYRQYKIGDLLILNNEAIVQWNGLHTNGVTFKTKGGKDASGAEITIKFSDVIKLQRAPANKKVLSAVKRVKAALPSRRFTEVEKLLKIDTFGNKEFIKNRIALISKHKSFNESFEMININSFSLNAYFNVSKVDENGVVDIEAPLMVSNNLSNLALYVTISNSISKIIIDGFCFIEERGTDFLDIDAKSIPTILITDLSEIGSFDLIGNYGFDFFNFTKREITLEKIDNSSPFYSLTEKFNNYLKLNIIKEICRDDKIELLVKKIHSIEKDESNNDLVNIKILLIQIINVISRIAYVPNANEISTINQKITGLEALFIKNKIWLGNSYQTIDDCISVVKSLIDKISSHPTEKCLRLTLLIETNKYNYIICPNSDEAQSLKNYFTSFQYKSLPNIISVAEVNENLLSNLSVKAIITGWGKTNIINKILSSFVFDDITLLFYQFENKYFNSLERKNRKLNGIIKPTISSNGLNAKDGSIDSNGFEEFYNSEGTIESVNEDLFDISEFELKLDNAQYAKYSSHGNIIESIKAKRIDFENNFFIFSTESHKFLVINEFLDGQTKKPNLYRRKPDAFRSGDVIALINTDKDILVELVEKNTESKELLSVKKWTDLWKNLLKDYFISIGSDFRKLVEDLRENDCYKHEMTIKAWLQDESRIGPDDNSDLISIALLTNSYLLLENINIVRESIKKMIGWRMKASDYITEKIKNQIFRLIGSSIINNKVQVEGLGSIYFLKITDISNVWDNIDIRYVNKLMQKELI